MRITAPQRIRCLHGQLWISQRGNVHPISDAILNSVGDTAIDDLNECGTCGKPVAITARRCPQCGALTPPFGRGRIIGTLWRLFFVGLFFAWLFRDFSGVAASVRRCVAAGVRGCFDILFP